MGTNRRVRVFQITHNINMLDQYLAQDKGFYAEQQLDVETFIGTENPGRNPAEMLARGEIDFGIAGFMILLPAIRHQLAIKFVLYTRQDPPHRLVGRPHVRNVEDLRGKRIGVAAGTALYYFLVRRWLRENKLDPDKDVEFLHRDPEFLKEFHVAGSPWAREAYFYSTDAFLVDELKRELYRKLGFHELVETYESYPGSSTHGIVATQEVIDQDPDLVRRMVTAHIRVARYIQDQAEEVIHYIAEKWKVSDRVAARCYQRMKAVFIADVDRTHLVRELEVMQELEEFPQLPDIQPEDFIEAKFFRTSSD